MRQRVCVVCSGPILLGSKESASRYSTRNYCGLKCWYSRDSVPLGTERRLPINAKSHDLEWFVKDSMFRCGSRGGRACWKRKAVMVAEKLLGRSLSNSESHIVFIDGNRLNCCPTNLLIPSRHLFYCQVCRKPFSETPSRKPHNCLRCSFLLRPFRQPIDRNHYSSLGTRQIAAVKALYPITDMKAPSDTRGTITNLSYPMVARWFAVSTSAIQKISNRRTWKGVTAMSQKKVWRALLSQHDAMVKKSGVLLYDRVTLLARVYEDPYYLKEMLTKRKSSMEELDRRVSDTCANFMELFQILRMFPRKSQWASGNLNEMKGRMLEKLRDQSKSNGGSGKKKGRKKVEIRHTATLSEVRDLKAENERLKHEIKSANQIIKSLENQLEAARETIGSLNETISLVKLARQQAATVKPQRSRAEA